MDVVCENCVFTKLRKVTTQVPNDVPAQAEDDSITTVADNFKATVTQARNGKLIGDDVVFHLKLHFGMNLSNVFRARHMALGI